MFIIFMCRKNRVDFCALFTKNESDLGVCEALGSVCECGKTSKNNLPVHFGTIWERKSSGKIDKNIENDNKIAQKQREKR